MNISTKLLAAILSVSLLAACSDRVSQAEQEMSAIRGMSAPPIEPLPKPVMVEDFIYSADNIRSPFLAPSLLARQAQIEQGDSVKPDIDRTKEPLESYELAQLIYRGRVVAPTGEIYGLIQLPDNSIRDVQVGQYVGVNDGRILEITPTQINLEEIVADPRGGFAKRITEFKSPE